MMTSFNLANAKMGPFPTGVIRRVLLLSHPWCTVLAARRPWPGLGLSPAPLITPTCHPSSPPLPALQADKKHWGGGWRWDGSSLGGRGGRIPLHHPPAPSTIPSPALTPLCPAKGLLRRRVCVERCVSPLSSLMRVKRLTGLLPAIISIALQVSLRTAGPHGRSILLPASPGCCELVGAQLGHPERKRWKSDLSIHFIFFF